MRYDECLWQYCQVQDTSVSEIIHSFSITFFPYSRLFSIHYMGKGNQWTSEQNLFTFLFISWCSSVFSVFSQIFLSPIKHIFFHKFAYMRTIFVVFFYYTKTIFFSCVYCLFYNAFSVLQYCNNGKLWKAIYKVHSNLIELFNIVIFIIILLQLAWQCGKRPWLLHSACC